MSGNDIVGFIKINKLRSFLTILIIATGITSLTGVLTAVDSLKREVVSNFEKMGTGSFSITAKKQISENTVKRVRVRNPRTIPYHQAVAFKRQFLEPHAVSIFTQLGNMPVKHKGVSCSNPMMGITAADEAYFVYRNLTISDGRMLSVSDVGSSLPVCVLGYDIAKSLFRHESPVGKYITIAGIRYLVIGTLAGRGSSFGGGPDSEIIIPITNARLNFTTEETSYSIGVCSEDQDQAESLFRAIRRLSPSDGTDFSINTSDAMIGKLSAVTGIITAAAAVTGLVTLLAAAIGLMNIMLVSVKERTREIGIRKAVGASAANIRCQFLMESIIISEIGCVVGTVTGILAGNCVAMLLGASFIIPWGWILFAVLMCLVVGVTSGYMPAAKAAALDPVEALRCE